jgi:glycosyltransferase involved in cell wall biosynthesis
VPSTTRPHATSALVGETARNGARPRVFYVTYDGVEEPLGRSQVLAYLAGLAGAYDITLISFEKSAEAQRGLLDELARSGIAWRRLRYHRRPPVLSTTWDVMAGRRALVRAARSGRPAIVHVRSDVPALMALWARRAIEGELLFDIRGFWADERVDGDLWRPGGVLYRVAKRCERSFFAEADAIVTLTHASVPHVRAWARGRAVPIEVIPTCVDIGRFAGRPERPGGPHVVWSGSVGTWYRFDLAPRLAAALSLPLTVVTRQGAQARRLLGGHPASVRSAAPDRVPAELFERDIGLCLIRSSFSKVASAPTRFAEYLAAGMPVVVTRGVGDLEAIVEDGGVGVVLQGDDDESIAAAAAGVRALAGDPDLPERCRRLARERFDLATGTARYAEIYRRLLGRQ